MTRCNEVLDHIYEYLNRHDITEEFSVEIREHLDLCRPCFTRVQFEEGLLERLKKANQCCCPDSLKQKIQTLVDKF